MTQYRFLTARPPAEAVIILGALQAEGLDARGERNGLGAVYGLTSGGFGTRILVHEQDYETAVLLLSEIEQAPNR